MDAYTRSGSPGMVGASARFSWKPTIAPSRSRLDDAELAGQLLFDRNRRDADLRPLLLVEFDHLADVHAVDVIRAEDHHQMRDPPARSD